MKNIFGIDPEVYEDQYEWLVGGYLADVDEDFFDDPEEDEDNLLGYDEDDVLDYGEDDDFPLSLEYDEGEDDMYADGDFYTNDPGDW